MKSPLLKHLKDISKYHPEIYNNIKVEIDSKLYWYGPQFKYAPEKHIMYYKLLLSKIGPIIINTFKSLLFGIYRKLISTITGTHKKGKKININLERKKVVLGSRAFCLDQNLEKIGFEIIDSPRGFGGIKNIKIFIQTMKIKKKLFYGNFKEIISKDFIDMVLEYKKNLKKFYQDNNIKALFVSNNVNFFESLSIDIFEELGLPSFEFIHGLPGVQGGLFISKPNYKLVWGEKMKEDFEKIGGMNPNKIFVSGHPYYNKLSDKKLRFGLDDILVLCKAGSGGGTMIARPDLNYTITSDIGNSIGYLYSIEETLKQCGIKSVRLRPHPCESIDRYKKFINTDFFIFDTQPLSQSLTKASLVIGPGSTVLLEAIYYGVNYLLYEPHDKDNICLMNRPLITPYDGSNPKVPVAANEKDLYDMIKNKVMLDKSIFNDYIKTPFNIDFVKSIIK